MGVWIYPETGETLVVRFDAIESEEHLAELEITDHPVEVDADITDHIKKKLDTFTFTGLISNTPIYADTEKMRGELANVTGQIPRYFPPPSALPGYITRIAADPTLTGLFGPPTITAQLLVFREWFDAIRETWETLLELQESASLVRIVTSVREYENMLLESMQLPRANTDGTCAAFNLHFRQIRVVESGLVLAPPVPAEPRGAKAKDKGAQGNKTPSPELASMAYQAGSGLLSMIGL